MTVFYYFLIVLIVLFIVAFLLSGKKVEKQIEDKPLQKKTQHNLANDESYEYEEDAEKDDYEGDDIRDIYNKKTPKYSKKGYQTKNYRGTDIEIAGFESVKDLKSLHRDDLNTIDTEDLDKEVDKVEAEERKKPVEAPKPDPASLKSGIAGTKSAMAKMVLEVKENYMSGGSVSALDNFEHKIKSKDGGGHSR